MIRLVARAILHLLANGVGLLAAAALLKGFSIDPVTLVTATVIFTLIEVLANPMLASISEKNLPSLTGGVALVTTFAGLLVTTAVSEGLSIDGLSTWLLASVIVWGFSLLAGVVLPLFLFKQWLGQQED